jgi:peptidoglycan hydrolase-like protein with peptidoglycan-binding domain
VLIASAAPVIVTATQSPAKRSSTRRPAERAPAATKRPATSSAKRATTSGKKAASTKKNSKPISRAQNAPTPERISEIQSALQREGALGVELNGKWDSATVEAMKKYQGNHGLNPSGKIDALTLHKLGLGSETAGKGAPSRSVSSADPPSSSAPQADPGGGLTRP